LQDVEALLVQGVESKFFISTFLEAFAILFFALVLVGTGIPFTVNMALLVFLGNGLVVGGLGAGFRGSLETVQASHVEYGSELWSLSCFPLLSDVWTSFV